VEASSVDLQRTHSLRIFEVSTQRHTIQEVTLPFTSFTSLHCNFVLHSDPDTNVVRLPRFSTFSPPCTDMKRPMRPYRVLGPGITPIASLTKSGSHRYDPLSRLSAPNTKRFSCASISSPGSDWRVAYACGISKPFCARQQRSFAWGLAVDQRT